MLHAIPVTFLDIVQAGPCDRIENWTNKTNLVNWHE
jgi:hypothetical protein